MPNLIGPRFKQYIKYKSLYITGVAKELGTSQPTLSAILSGKRPISQGMLARISQLYPDINIDWLLTGEGDMLNTSDEVLPEGMAAPAISENTAQVHYFDVTPTASFQELDEAVSQGYDTIAVVPMRGERLDDNYCVFEIHGDSMAPTVLSHARVLCKNIPEAQWHYAEGVVVVAYGNKVVIKRVAKNEILTANSLTLSSDNPSYNSETVQLSDIHSIYKAKRIISQDIY